MMQENGCAHRLELGLSSLLSAPVPFTCWDAEDWGEFRSSVDRLRSALNHELDPEGGGKSPRTLTNHRLSCPPHRYPYRIAQLRNVLRANVLRRVGRRIIRRATYNRRPCGRPRVAPAPSCSTAFPLLSPIGYDHARFP